MEESGNGWDWGACCGTPKESIIIMFKNKKLKHKYSLIRKSLHESWKKIYQQGKFQVNMASLKNSLQRFK